MNYNPDFFEEHILTHTDCIYKKAILTPFYMVYVSDDGRYHIAKEEYESIRERMYFYQTYIAKEEKYPVYLKNIGLWMEGRNSQERLLQVLSLPKEICFEVKEGNEVLRSFDEILSLLSFEEGLNEKKQNLYVKKEDIKGDSPVLNMAINDLMANGFYLMDIEKVTSSNPEIEDDDYPFYVHEAKIPSDLLSEKETSHKLIMDFVSNPLLITRDVYKKYYARLDKMSLEEKAAYAFEKVDMDTLVRPEADLRMALRRYFYTMARIILNRFFSRRFGSQLGLGFTVLDHDFKADQLKYRMIYLGTHHDMYASSYRTFSLEDGVVRETYQPRDYVLDETAMKKLTYSFPIVQRYFKRHPEYCFLPSVFLKVLGLPYPAFEMTRYFDFENGDVKSFLQLFRFESDCNYDKNGLLLPIVTADGLTIEEQDGQGYGIPFLLRKMEEDRFFLSDLLGLGSSSDIEYLFGFSSKKQVKFLSLTNGEISLYEEALSRMEDMAGKRELLPEGHAFMSRLRKFVLQEEKGGILLPIRDYFRFMNDGLSSLESLRKVKENKPSLDMESLRFMILLASDVTLSKKAGKYVSEPRFRPDYLLLDCHEEFYDPYLKYPYVHKGRFFYVYEDDEHHYHMEKRDQETIRALHHIFKKHFPKTESFPFAFHVNGEERILFSYPIRDAESAEFQFLGLPDVFGQFIEETSVRECLKQVSFEEGISIYDEQRHAELLRQDESLSSLFVFQEGFRNDVYLTQKTPLPCPTYMITAHNQRDYMQYLDYDFLSVELDGTLEPKSPDDKRSPFYQMYKSDFNNAMRSCVVDGSTIFEEDEDMDVPLNFAGQMLSCLYHIYDQRLFQRKEVESYINSFEYHGVYVSPGCSFYAYSDSKDGKYGILKEHVDDFYALFELLRDRAGHLYDIRDRAKFIVYHLGVPVALRKPLCQYLYENRLNLKKEDIPVYEGSLPFSEDDLPDFVSLFSVEKQSFTGLFEKSKNRRKLLSQGFYIYPDSHLFSEKFSDADSVTENSGAMILSIMKNECSVFKKPCGIVKETLQPNEVTMHIYIKKFLSAYQSNPLFTEDTMMMVMEFLIFAYHNDNDFFIHFINTYQGHEKDMSDTFFNDMVARFSKEFTRKGKKYDIIFLICTILFALYLEQKMMACQIILN